jgi:hypothetical protein
MIESIRDFLGDISGYRPKYLDAIELLDACSEDKKWLISELNKRDELIRQLKLLTSRPAPPEITYIVERDTVWVQQQLNSMGLSIVRLPLDTQYRLTNHSNMLNIVAWDTTDQIQYIRERFDCENFAILFKAIVDLYFGLNQVALILDYISKHSYNLILYPNEKHEVCEPQSDGLYLWTRRIEDFYSMRGAFATI